MLSLERHVPAKGRRRQGQHARHPGAPGREQAPASARRHEMPGSGRLLSRLTRTVLARRSAAAGPSEPAGTGGEAWALYPGLSVACLLGECQEEPGRPVCDGGSCEHDCHLGVSLPGMGPAAGTVPAA